MDMKLVDTIRNCGWTDRYGCKRYGNAAILCFLSFLQTRIADIEPHSIKCGEEAVEQILQKTA